MARSLSYALNQIQLTLDRRPTFRLRVYDINATDANGDFLNTVSDVVLGFALATQVGPRDFSGDISSVQVEETAGDYAGEGIAASVITFTVEDPSRRFDPATLVADPTGDGRWLRRGNLVRVWVGDERVPEDDWVIVFTGRITGNAGVNRTRVPASGGPVSQIQVKAVGREADFIRYTSTSSEFGQGTTHQAIAETIAQEDMGLDISEIHFANFSPLTTNHTSTQFADEPPLVSIAHAMFPSGLMPKFDGAGFLTQTVGSIERGSDRVYEDAALFEVIQSDFGEVNPANRVTVKGLDGEQSRVVQPRQVLAEIQITTGFFTQEERVKAYWSDDRTIFAQNVDLQIEKSVNGGLLPLGGDESFTEIPTGGPAEGTIGAILEIDTGWAPELILFFTVLYIVLAAIPDEVALGSITIPVGRIEQAVQLALMLLIMLRVGRGTYQFTGEPFEYVYQELVGVAEIDGVRTEDLVDIVIENHLLQTQSAVDAAARDVLFREQAKGNPRTISMLHDLGLQPDDIFEVFDLGRRFLVASIRYTLTRGVGPIRASVTAYEVTEGSFQ